MECLYVVLISDQPLSLSVQEPVSLNQPNIARKAVGIPATTQTDKMLMMSIWAETAGTSANAFYKKEAFFAQVLKPICILNIPIT